MKKEISVDSLGQLIPNRENKVVRGRPRSATETMQSKSVRPPVKKKFFRRRNVILGIVMLVVLLVGGLALYVRDLFADVMVAKLDPNLLGINNMLNQQYGGTHKIKNIALFGLDSRSKTDIQGRSDSIMVLSVDQDTGTLKLTSILRDSLVPIQGYGKEKIAHAFAYGGETLAIHTINQAYQLDIKDYIAINFQGFSDIVDILGGIEIDITEAERKQINIYANRDGFSSPILSSSGLTKLNGVQAMAYSRIRKIDSEDERVNRQQKVLDLIFEKIKKMPPLEYPTLLKKIMPLVKTSLNMDEILSFVPMMLGEVQLKKNTVPSEADNAIGGIYQGVWLWRYDLEEAAKRLHHFIYDTAEEN